MGMVRLSAQPDTAQNGGGVVPQLYTSLLIKLLMMQKNLALPRRLSKRSSKRLMSRFTSKRPRRLSRRLPRRSSRRLPRKPTVMYQRTVDADQNTVKLSAQPDTAQNGGGVVLQLYTSLLIKLLMMPKNLALPKRPSKKSSRRLQERRLDLN